MSASALKASAAGLLAGFGSDVLSTLTSPAVRAAGYYVNSVEPNALPDINTAITLYNQGRIPSSQLEQIAQRHGAYWSVMPDGSQLNSVWRAVVESGECLPELGQIYRLRNQARMDDRELDKLLLRLGYKSPTVREWLAALRQPPLDLTTAFQLVNRGFWAPDQLRRAINDLGFTDRDLNDQIARLREYVIPPTDTIRLMVRDVFDPKVIEAFKLDAEFTDKFDVNAEKRFAAVGMDKATAQLYWRAHWQLPSPGQVFEMVHRLRPGKVDPDIATTTDDVRLLLAQNDTLPFWRDRLAAISYRPLTRIDARRAFELEVLNETGLKDAYLDLGYAEEQADTLVDYIVADVAKKKTAKWGNLTVPKVRAFYRDSAMDRRTATARLTALDLTDDEITAILADAEIERAAKARAKCLRALRGRLFLGDIDRGQATAEVVKLGTDPDQADALVAEWECELRYKAKEVATATLCKWFQQGLIGEPAYRIRLGRIGWPGPDIDAIVASCRTDLAVKQVKAHEKATKEKERKRKESERDKEKRRKEEEKRAKEEEKMREKKAKEEEKKAKAAEK